jgi:hypothetical protein
MNREGRRQIFPIPQSVHIPPLPNLGHPLIHSSQENQVVENKEMFLEHISRFGSLDLSL